MILSKSSSKLANKIIEHRILYEKPNLLVINPYSLGYFKNKNKTKIQELYNVNRIDIVFAKIRRCFKTIKILHKLDKTKLHK